MTYNVFGGTLSLTQSINQQLIVVHLLKNLKAQLFRWYIVTFCFFRCRI